MDPATKCRKKHDSEDSKRRLLKAALDIFAKEGYDAATTRAIAKKAGVNDALIQRYFDGKLGLLLALSMEFRATVIHAFVDGAHGTLEETLDTFFRGRAEFAQKNKKIIKIMTTQAILSPEYRAHMTGLSKEAAPELLRNLQILQVRGEIHASLDLAKFTQMINSISTGLSLVTHVIGITDPMYLDDFVPLFIEVLGSAMKKQRGKAKAA